ncbi:hypothetical protein L596_011911 [Steinernema carpocapsae]|uniref:Nuclear receptor domain-containing protein n=1 Tax=Steinernema carpocapsae TaxID=34508 RepID=A0A4U5NVF1_STECR|nr:hypothetical protein L596_011911 [Steinernema carpocapsae]
MSADELCLVCNGPSVRLHFQVNSCRACAAFFRRSVQIGHAYKCRRAMKNCEIVKNSKNNCRYCRYQKCKQVGMKMSSQAEETVEQEVSLEPEKGAPSTSTTSIASSSQLVELSPFQDEHVSQIVYADNRSSYNRAPVVKQLKEILSGPSLKIPTTIGIRPTAMQRLHHSFRIFRPTLNSCNIYNIETLSLNTLLRIFDSEQIKMAQWAMGCEEFIGLEMNDKWNVFKHLWRPFYSVERIARTIEVFGCDINDSRFLLDDQTVVDINTYTLEFPPADDSTKRTINHLFKPHNLMIMTNLITPMKEIRLTEYEVVYLLAQILWTVKSFEGVSDQAGAIGEKFLDQISNEIHNYYVYDMKVENYAGRLTKLMKIQAELEKQALYKKDLITVANVFDVFKCDIFDSELL